VRENGDGDDWRAAAGSGDDGGNERHPRGHHHRRGCPSQNHDEHLLPRPGRRRRQAPPPVGCRAAADVVRCVLCAAAREQRRRRWRPLCGGYLDDPGARGLWRRVGQATSGVRGGRARGPRGNHGDGEGRDCGVRSRGRRGQRAATVSCRRQTVRSTNTPTSTAVDRARLSAHRPFAHVASNPYT